MAVDRTLLAEDLFHRALALPADARAGFLERECGVGSELYREVESLLAAHASVGDFLLTPRPPPATQAHGVGSRVGRWRLLREIGAGGMGTVFLGARDDGAFEQQVAIKLIRGGFDAGASRDELARRFIAERQHLAHLDHPHVAKLLDGGTTEDGTPYLVMEYVEGAPLVAYCETHALPLEARLELFREVCLAVQYVHSKLIAHRDLKPSNILVGDSPAPGGAPVVKLLDFGIAKLLHGDAQLTATIGAQRLTPAYAAPEQFKSEPITTASDVYSLGVILFELVTGRLPHPTEGTTPVALARAVCETPPPPPRSVRPDVPSDVETIVLKALEKAPERRYAGASALAEDLERFLTGHPILARPASRAYRFAKLVSRNKLASAFAAAFVVALAGSGAWLAVLYARSLRAEELAEQRRDVAERSNAILRSLFDAPDPFAAHGKDVTVAEVLDDAAPRALAGLDDQPLVRREIAAVIGETYRKLGAYEKAEPYVRDALALARELAVDDRELVVALINAGTLLAQRANWGESEALMREGYELAERKLGPDARDTLSALDGLGVAVRELNRLEEAEQLSRLALERARRAFGLHARPTWQALNNLASLVNDLGRYEEAGALWEEGLAAIGDASGDDRRFVQTLRYSYAMNLYHRGRLEQSERMLREVLAQRRELLGDEHPETLETEVWLGIVITQRSGAAEAVELLARAFEAEQRVFGREHETTLGTGIEYGRTLQTLGRLDEAKAVLEPTYEALVRRFGPGHYLSIGALATLATHAQLSGDWDRAILRQRELVGASELGLGPRHTETLRSRVNLGAMLQQGGFVEESAQVSQRVFDDLRETLGPTNELSVNAQANLASALRELRRYDEALALFDDLMRIANETMDGENFQLAWFHYVWGRAFDEAGNTERATEELARGFEDLMRTIGPRHELTQRAGRYYAEFLDRYGEFERANGVREALEGTGAAPQK